jgi:hypothetical protein
MAPSPELLTTRPRETLRAAFIEHVADHPVIANYRRKRDGRPYAISDFLSAVAFYQTGIYRDFAATSAPRTSSASCYPTRS